MPNPFSQGFTNLGYALFGDPRDKANAGALASQAALDRQRGQFLLAQMETEQAQKDKIAAEAAGITARNDAIGGIGGDMYSFLQSLGQRPVNTSPIRSGVFYGGQPVMAQETMPTASSIAATAALAGKMAHMANGAGDITGALSRLVAMNPERGFADQGVNANYPQYSKGYQAADNEAALSRVLATNQGRLDEAAVDNRGAMEREQLNIKHKENSRPEFVPYPIQGGSVWTFGNSAGFVPEPMMDKYERDEMGNILSKKRVPVGVVEMDTAIGAIIADDRNATRLLGSNDEQARKNGIAFKQRANEKRAMIAEKIQAANPTWTKAQVIDYVKRITAGE